MALPEDSSSLLRLQEMEHLDRCDHIEFIFILQVPDIADRELCVWKAEAFPGFGYHPFRRIHENKSFQRYVSEGSRSHHSCSAADIRLTGPA